MLKKVLTQSGPALLLFSTLTTQAAMQVALKLKNEKNDRPTPTPSNISSKSRP